MVVVVVYTSLGTRSFRSVSCMMRLLITGGAGFIGRIWRSSLPPAIRYCPSSAELDLLSEQAVREYSALTVSTSSFMHTIDRTGAYPLPGPAGPQLPHVLHSRAQPVRNSEDDSLRFGAEYDAFNCRQSPGRRFDTRVPDAYGFSKYICAKYIERSNGCDLRLFGVFGAYEDYTVRFISTLLPRAQRIAILCGRISRFDYSTSRPGQADDVVHRE